MPADIQGLHRYLEEQKIQFLQKVNAFSATTLDAVAQMPYIPETYQEALDSLVKVKKIMWLMDVSSKFSSIDSFINAIKTAIINAQTSAEIQALTEELQVLETYKSLSEQQVPGK